MLSKMADIGVEIEAEFELLLHFSTSNVIFRPIVRIMMETATVK